MKTSVVFFNILEDIDLQLYLKHTPTQVFSFQYCKTFKNSFFSKNISSGCFYLQFVDFYPVWRLLSSAKNLTSVDTFSQPGDFCSVRKFYLVQIPLIQFGDFYAVCILLSSLEVFVQCEDIYSVQMLLSKFETFIQFVDFYLVWKLLSSAEIFSQCRDFIQRRYFQPVQRLFTQFGDFYPVHRLLSSLETFVQ